MFEYFYGTQADQFAFFRIPKVLFKDSRYKSLSSDAKILYGILLDRMNLSALNGWIDQLKRVYIIYTIEELMEDMDCANQKATKLMSELDKIGLIERKRQGLGRPNLIYVKNFIVREAGDSGDKNMNKVEETVESHLQNHEKHDSKSVDITNVDSRKSHGNNTENNNTDFNNNNLILSAGCDGCDEQERRSCEDYFRESLEVESLLEEEPYERERVQGILDLIVDTCCSNKSAVRIGGEEKPISVVKGQFMKLHGGHLRYVMKCMDENTTKIRNIKQYLLAALYNSPMTMQPYYQAWVNNDMYGGDKNV